jgi:hypothetical protein
MHTHARATRWHARAAIVFALALMSVDVLYGSEGASVSDSTVSVRDHGAVGDGVADDTQAFQTAMDAVGDAGGGIVEAPRGTYRIDGTLSVPASVTLEGVFRAVPSHAGIRDRGQPMPDSGTVLLAYAGAGSEDGDPFITINGNATLRGLVVFYPEQVTDDIPTPYPWTIAMRSNNPSLIDVELLNPYNGIDCTKNQRHLVRNVQGQPLRRGIYVDSIYDVGRIENVHWNPWFSMKEKLFQWQMEHGEAFIFGRTDWQYVLNTFCFGYRIGYRFVESETGACNGNFLGIGADDCWVAVQVDQSARMGLLITNGEFVSFHGPDPTMVVVSEENRGSVRFVNCAYWGPHNQIAKVGGGTVGFSDCTFMQWDREKEGRHAIQATGGSLIVRGCEFQTDAPQVSLTADVKRAIITGNLFNGAARISDAGAGNVQIGLNSATED